MYMSLEGMFTWISLITLKTDHLARVCLSNVGRCSSIRRFSSCFPYNGGIGNRSWCRWSFVSSAPKVSVEVTLHGIFAIKYLIAKSAVPMATSLKILLICSRLRRAFQETLHHWFVCRTPKKNRANKIDEKIYLSFRLAVGQHIRNRQTSKKKERKEKGKGNTGGENIIFQIKWQQQQKLQLETAMLQRSVLSKNQETKYLLLKTEKERKKRKKKDKKKMFTRYGFICQHKNNFSLADKNVSSQLEFRCWQRRPDNCETCHLVSIGHSSADF